MVMVIMESSPHHFRSICKQTGSERDLTRLSQGIFDYLDSYSVNVAY